MKKLLGSAARILLLKRALQQKHLGFFREICRDTGLPLHGCRRELGNLVELGILQDQYETNLHGTFRHFYNQNNPIVYEKDGLKVIIELSKKE